MLRRASALALLAVLTLMASGCVTAQPPPSLTVYGPYVGPEATRFGEVLTGFEQATGIKVGYLGSGAFQNDFQQRVATADLPDVVLLPQPALLPELIDQGRARPLSDDQGAQVLAAVGSEWTGVISRNGIVFAVPYRVVVKSLVWFRTDIFTKQGYAVPRTLGELHDLQTKMIADGFTPWCSGMDDGRATGWWATDWVEDLVLRRSGAGTYQSWAQLKTPFDGGAVRSALDELQQDLSTPGTFRGGRRAILNTPASAAMDPMFDSPPGCLMHKQASFQANWLPAGQDVGDGQLDVFALPPATSGPAPLVISGEMAVATSSNPAALRLLTYLLEVRAFDPWRGAEGSLQPRSTQDPATAVGALDQRLVKIWNSAEVIAYDASDLMPPAVGTGTFFTGIVDLVAGAPTTTVAKQIQASVDQLGSG